MRTRAALDDMHHAYTWFDDPSASYMVFGDITRKGDKLAVGEDGFAATHTIRLYSVVGPPTVQGRRARLPLPAREPARRRLRIRLVVTRRSVAHLPGRWQRLHHPRRRDRGRLRQARQSAPARRRRHLTLMGPGRHSVATAADLRLAIKGSDGVGHIDLTEYQPHAVRISLGAFTI